ncbi:hypothetical protein VTN96DRAFT_6231 [Rasamsonia emersonii]
MTEIGNACLACLSAVDRWCHISDCLAPFRGRSREGIYETTLADSEREAVADLLQYLENRAETDFFSGEPLRALSTLVYSDNVDLQRSASLTFAEITERDVREVGRETLEPILSLLQSPDIEVQRAASAALGNLAVNYDVPQRRGAVQCRRLHYELGNTRRQQVQDCPVGCSGPVDTARKVQGYACPT